MVMEIFLWRISIRQEQMRPLFMVIKAIKAQMCVVIKAIKASDVSRFLNSESVSADDNLIDVNFWSIPLPETEIGDGKSLQMDRFLLRN